MPFLVYAPEIRKVIYTTNAIESLNYTLRKVTRNRQAFPTSEAAMKLVYMALQNISRRWTMPVQNWMERMGIVGPAQGSKPREVIHVPER